LSVEVDGVLVGFGVSAWKPQGGLLGHRQIAGDGDRVGRHAAPAGHLERPGHAGAEGTRQAVAAPGVERNLTRNSADVEQGS
jgi:hypothetical protein